ncbi:hypothetical protein GA0061083_1665 [Pseudarthrobacter enclensis]|nr:hypothetical protein GA0061083_1665 [Pseudarthrobacter enclensis]
MACRPRPKQPPWRGPRQIQFSRLPAPLTTDGKQSMTKLSGAVTGSSVSAEPFRADGLFPGWRAEPLERSAPASWQCGTAPRESRFDLPFLRTAPPAPDAEFGHGMAGIASRIYRSHSILEPASAAHNPAALLRSFASGTNGRGPERTYTPQYLCFCTPAVPATGSCPSPAWKSSGRRARQYKQVARRQAAAPPSWFTHYELCSQLLG